MLQTIALTLLKVRFHSKSKYYIFVYTSKLIVLMPLWKT